MKKKKRRDYSGEYWKMFPDNTIVYNRNMDSGGRVICQCEDEDDMYLIRNAPGMYRLIKRFLASRISEKEFRDQGEVLIDSIETDEVWKP